MAESSLRLPEDQRLDLVQGPFDNQAVILHSLKDLSDLAGFRHHSDRLNEAWLQRLENVSPENDKK